MEYIIRPLGVWLEPVTEDRRGAHLFKASWADTLTLLGYELERLGAYQAVFQIDVTEGELRRDGMLRAQAKVGFPGVRVSFTSIHGPLTYATDAYERQYGWSKLDGWQANIRAIALGLQALRAVDRYGVTRRGEQYRGWQALTAQPAGMTDEQAAEFIAHWADDPVRFTATTVLTDPAARDRAFKVAASKTHPDRTGDKDTLARLSAARAQLAKLDAT